nr:hypothetical protein [uncultured Cellulosilyticum sp.]
MILDRQNAIEEIIKGVFELTEFRAVHLAGTIYGMVISNGLNSIQQKSNKIDKKKDT